jgi:hypothetical protein
MDYHALSLGESFLLDVDTARETDQEHNTHISDFLSNMQTYNMEFDVERASVFYLLSSLSSLSILLLVLCCLTPNFVV